MARGKPQPRELHDDEMLSQFGRMSATDTFRRRPRNPGENDVSLIIGAKTADEAAAIVVGKPLAAQLSGRSMVRCTTVGALRAAGFSVNHTPNKRNPEHVSVTHQQAGALWPEELCTVFDECFGR